VKLEATLLEWRVGFVWLVDLRGISQYLTQL
jgi:hypothetical protein